MMRTNQQNKRIPGIRVPLLILLCMAVISVFPASTKAIGPAQSLPVRQTCVRIILPANSGPITQRASELLAREITERSNTDVVTTGKAAFIVELAVKPGIGTEGFTIAADGSGKVKITGNDENGLLYGVGKFLHTSSYGLLGFTPGTWRGTSVPQCPIRGMNVCTHFNNWYETANDAERKRYLEDMALWGENVMIVYFPSPWVKGFDDPVARESLRLLNTLMADAKSVGMKLGITFGNDMGFSDTPKEFLATKGPWNWGDVLICPSKPGAMEYMEKNLAQLLNEFPGTGLDYVLYWPYDEGGCSCKDCSPWGANGYPRMCQKFTSVVRAKFPKAKFILGTWMFDYNKWVNGVPVDTLRTDGEYAGLSAYLAKDKSWVDYLMVDGHGDFPKYPLKVGAPGGLPMINFPEISMIGQYPWGGYGANPLPQRFQRLWDQTERKLAGGAPYSEGIFEDINKIVCYQFYWNPDCPATEAVKEYISYEYSPDVVDSVSKAIELLEQNHMRKVVVNKNESPSGGNGYLYGTLLGGSRIEFLKYDQSPLSQADRYQLEKTSAEAFKLIEQADAKLTSHARASWRWRILYLRALIDRELVRNNGWFEGPTLKAAFDELTRIFHSESTCLMIHVPQIRDAEAEY